MKEKFIKAITLYRTEYGAAWETWRRAVGRNDRESQFSKPIAAESDPI